MTKLTKIFKDQKFTNAEGFGTETRTMVTVNYDPIDNSVEIDSIVVEEERIHKFNGIVTYSPLINRIDVTESMFEVMPSLQKDIDSMDWESEYRLSKEEEEVEA